MRDLSRMILGASSTSPNRTEEVQTANGDRKSTFAAVAASGSNLERSSGMDDLDTEMKNFSNLNRSPERTRPTSEERKINRPTTKHFFTLDNQERKR